MQELHGEDAVLHVVFGIDEFTQIPGLGICRAAAARKRILPHWYGIYDDQSPPDGGHQLQPGCRGLMGRGQQPGYPEPMTGTGLPLRRELRRLCHDALGLRPAPATSRATPGWHHGRRPLPRTPARVHASTWPLPGAGSPCRSAPAWPPAPCPAPTEPLLLRAARRGLRLRLAARAFHHVHDGLRPRRAA